MTTNLAAALVALALLGGEPGTPETVSAQDWPAVQTALHRLGVDLEILDPRETRYVLARLEDFQSDLDLLRRRREEYADAPAVAEAERLPERAWVNDLLLFNRQHHRWLEAQPVIQYDRAWFYKQWKRENDRLYQVWDCVRDAKCEFYYVTVRRAALKKLRGLLGPQDYYTLKLPPCVPLWYFNAVP